MKEKILAALRAKYPGTQAALIDRVADTMAGTVTDETQIETIISGDGVKNLLTFFQSETDRRATEATKTAVANYEKQHNLKDGKPSTGNPEPPADTPEWAKTLIKQNQELAAKVQTLEKGSVTSGLMDRVKAKLTEKKIPGAFLKGRTIEKEEEIETLVSEIETDFQAVRQEMVNQNLVVDVPANPTPASTKVDADIEAWANSGQTKK
jgi:phenylalanyl-tRNA synthetase alpha subunit